MGIKFDTLKIYPNGFKVACLMKTDMDLVDKKRFECDCGQEDCWVCKIKDSKKAGNRFRSIRRVRNKVRDYGLSNDFKWFCTFTFAEQIYDRDECVKKVSKFWSNYRERVGSVKYVCMFERHKKGGWHVHCLIDNSIDEYMEFGKKRRNKVGGYYDSFTFTKWRFGFSTCEVIESREKSITYVLKYITKDVEYEVGKKAYLASRNLETPLVMKNVTIKGIDLNDCEEYEYCLLYKFDTDCEYSSDYY